jgi:hypothetical protein
MMTLVKTGLIRLRSKVWAVAVRSVWAALSPARPSALDVGAENSVTGASAGSKSPPPAPDNTAAPPRRVLPPAAQRALAEAAVRRAEADRLAAEAAKTRPKEFQGPKGPEPTRYGDWENKGIASDF